MYKLGLSLGGGGAKGSYQLGVLKALYEENLLDDLEVVSGTSIGALNTCFVMEQLPFDSMYDIWSSISNDLLYKHGLSRFKQDKMGLFDQTIMYDILVEKQNKENIINSPIKGYVAVSRIIDNKVLRQYNKNKLEPEILFLNESDDPHKLVLASSSIPLLFGPTLIGENYYVDGGLLNNLPMNVLEENECDVMIAVGLDPHDDLVSETASLIVDFTPTFRLTRTVLGMLDFNGHALDTRIDSGYVHAKELIDYLKQEEVIKDGRWNPKAKGTYSFKNIEESSDVE